MHDWQSLAKDECRETITQHVVNSALNNRPRCSKPYLEAPYKIVILSDLEKASDMSHS